MEFAPHLAGRPVALAAADAVTAAADAVTAAADGALQDDRAAGAALFAELGCAACHGMDGEGRAAPGDGSSWRDEGGRPIPATGDLRHACGLRAGASEAAIRRALRNGVGPVMPSFASALEGRPGAARAIRAWLLSRDPDRGATGASPTPAAP